MIALCVFIAIFGIGAIINAFEVECPYCYNCFDATLFVEEMGCHRQETWVCPNKTCGYENYAGIDHCGLCGTKRGR